jgi:hypothetical protein
MTDNLDAAESFSSLWVNPFMKPDGCLSALGRTRFAMILRLPLFALLKMFTAKLLSCYTRQALLFDQPTL